MVRYASTDGVLLLIKEFSGAVMMEQVAKFIPLVGTVIAASLGFAITRKLGSYYLNECHTLASTVLDHQLASQTRLPRTPSPV